MRAVSALSGAPSRGQEGGKGREAGAQILPREEHLARAGHSSLGGQTTRQGQVRTTYPPGPPVPYVRLGLVRLSPGVYLGTNKHPNTGETSFVHSFIFNKHLQHLIFIWQLARTEHCTR